MVETLPMKQALTVIRSKAQEEAMDKAMSQASMQVQEDPPHSSLKLRESYMM